jgi:Aminoglycoside N3''-acetyltransferase
LKKQEINIKTILHLRHIKGFLTNSDLISEDFMKKIYLFLKKFLPLSFLNNLRKYYYRIITAKIPALNEDEFRDILVNHLHVKKGRDLFIHSSLQLLKTSFPFYRLIPIIQEIVGEEATILFPTTHFSGKAIEYVKNPNAIFDVKRSPSIYGLLSELAIKAKGAKRSWHPTNSVVAIGKRAEEYVSEHHLDIYPCGKQSPYYKLIRNDALIIGLGVSTEYFSFVHCVEDCKEYSFPIETREKMIYSSKILTPDKNIIEVKTLVAHPRIKYRNIPKYLKLYVDNDVAKDMKIRGIPFYTAKAKELYPLMGKLAEQGKTIYTKAAN